MIKLTAAVTKRDDWTVSEWLTHYTERHASLSGSVDNFTRHSSRYLQNPAHHAPEVPDFANRDDSMVGVTELWFESVEGLRAAYSEPDYLRYLRTDELRFCSLDKIAAGVAREQTMFTDKSLVHGDKTYVYAPREKIFVFRTERNGLERGDFQCQWQEGRAPVLLNSEVFARVRRYVQSHMLDEDVGLSGELEHALIDEFWFDTTAEAVAFWSAYCASAEVQAEDAKYAQPDKTWVIFAREHEVFGPLPD